MRPGNRKVSRKQTKANTQQITALLSQQPGRIRHSNFINTSFIQDQMEQNIDKELGNGNSCTCHGTRDSFFLAFQRNDVYLIIILPVLLVSITPVHAG